MILTHKELSDPIINKSYFNILSIENTEFYTTLYRDFLSGTNSIEDQFSLFIGESEKTFSTHVIFAPSPFLLEITTRKIINKLYINLQDMAIDKGFDLMILSNIEEIADLFSELTLDLENIEFNPEISFLDLCKHFKVSFQFDYRESLLNNVKNYLMCLRDYSDVTLYVFSGLVPALTKDELIELSLFVNREHIYVLLFEGKIDDQFRMSNDNILVVDNDLCEIIR